MAFIDDLKNILGTNTLPEGKDIINQNFDAILQALLNNLTPENIDGLLDSEGKIKEEYITDVVQQLNTLVSDFEAANLGFDSENFQSTTVRDALEELFSQVQQRLIRPGTQQTNNLPAFGSAQDVFDSGVNAFDVIQNADTNVTTGSVPIFKDSTGRIVEASGVPGQANGFATLDADGKIQRNQLMPASNTRLYVDVGIGDDSFDGKDPTRPFKSIKAAVAAVEGPTTILIAAGDYTEDNPITLPDRVSIVGDELRNTRVLPQNPNLDFFHVKSLNYIYGLRFLDLRRPAFSVAFPSAIADSTLSGTSIGSISILYSPEGYTEAPDVDIDPPDEENGVQATAEVVLSGGKIVDINVLNAGSGYTERPNISIAAPKEQQPFITGSTYVQNCSSITGPFDTNGDKISPLAPLPYDFINGFTYTNPFTQEVVTHAPVDTEGAGGGMKIDGRVCFGYNNLSNQEGYKSPLRSMVGDAFTQVNQGGPGHLITNVGYAQFVSCFTTFCTYGYKAKNGGFANISNSVSDFGDVGLVAEGYERDFYTFGFSTTTQASSISGFDITFGGDEYLQDQTVSITGGGGAGATAIAEVGNDQSIAKITVTNGGSGYTSEPTIEIPLPSSGLEEDRAEAQVVLSGVSTIDLESFFETDGKVRRPDIGSIAEIGNQFVRINNVEETANGFRISFFPSVPSVNAGDQIYFYFLSNLSTGSHVFEYPGSGVTYNALPFYGGVPNDEREVQEKSPGKVYFSSTDNIGNFKVGKFFEVEQATGSVTINADQFNLAGLNSIGPFRVNGVPFGVQLREVTNNSNLESDSGLDENTAATVFAIREYVSDVNLEDLNNVDITDKFENDVVRWDSLSQRWVANGLFINELIDVDTETLTPTQGLGLVYGTSNWQPGFPIAALGLNNGSGKQINAGDVYDHVNNTSGNPHQLDATDVNAVALSSVGQPNGVAPLGVDGKISNTYMPGVFSGAVYAVSDITERNALNALEGDLARVADSDGSGTPATYVYDEDTSSWLSFNTPEIITSVNGQTGAVTLTTTEISEGSNQYYTSARAINDITSTVDSNYINSFFLSAQELRDTVDPNVSADAVAVRGHLDNIYDSNAVISGGVNQGANPHGLTPELIGAYPNTTTTDGIAEGSNNLYYTNARVQSVVNKTYVDALGVNAVELGGLGSGSFLRRDVSDSYAGVITGNKLVLGSNPINASYDDELQVNGSTRTGNIYLHEDGTLTDVPTNNFYRLTNIAGDLHWDDTQGNQYKVWTQGNMGSGSGLDADTLDGLNSTDFAALNHNHDASAIISGTLANARISQSNVTQHQSALNITESQITDLQSYSLDTHTHVPSEVGLGNVSNDAQVRRDELGVADGVATLDSTSKIPVLQIPDVALTKVKTVANTLLRDQEVVQEGDIIRVSDTNTIWIFDGDNWFEISQPDVIQSVNGYTGTVNLNTDDVDEGSTNRYFTDSRADNRIQNAIDDSTTSNVTLWSSTKINSVVTSLSTDDVDEGSTNKYYSSVLANADIDTRVTKAFVDALGVNADTLDGLNSTQFLRSDQNDTLAGNLTVNGTLEASSTLIIPEK